MRGHYLWNQKSIQVRNIYIYHKIIAATRIVTTSGLLVFYKMIALHHAISIYSCLASWPPSLDKSTNSIEMRTKNAFLFSKDQLDLVYLCWNLFAYIMKHINQTYYVMSIPSKYLNINVLQNLRCLKYYTSKRNTCKTIYLYTIPSGYPSVLLE